MKVYEFLKPGFKSYNVGETAAFGDGPDDIGPVLVRSGFARETPVQAVDPEKLRLEQAREHVRERTEYAKQFGAGQAGGGGLEVLAAIQAQTYAIADLAKAIASGRR